MTNKTPLYFAARNDQAELLLSQGASIEVLDQCDKTPLDYAAQNGKTGMVELLLHQSAPLHFAAEGGHTSILELSTPQQKCLY